MEMHERADDESLVQSAATGDEVAFSVLFDRYYSMIFAYAQRICLDASLAEDVAQEAFVKAARELALRPFRGSFKAWLYRVTRNGAIDLLRRRRREATHLPFDPERDSNHPQQLVPPETEYENLGAALARLHPEWRAAIALVYFDGLNHAEAARLLGCAEATVSWRVFQSKRKLRQYLQQMEVAQ